MRTHGLKMDLSRLVPIMGRSRGYGKFLSNYHADPVVFPVSRFPSRQFLWPEDGEAIAFPTGLHAWNAGRYLVLAQWCKCPARRVGLVKHARTFWKQPEYADELAWMSPRWARWNGSHKAFCLSTEEEALFHHPVILKQLRAWQRSICVYKYRHNKEVRAYLEALPDSCYMYHYGGIRVNERSYWWAKVDPLHRRLVGHNAVGEIWNAMHRVHRRLTRAAGACPPAPDGGRPPARSPGQAPGTGVAIGTRQ